MSTDAACMLVRGRYFISLLPSIYGRLSPMRHPGTRPIGVTCSPKKRDGDVDCRVRKAKGAFGISVLYQFWFKHLQSHQINHHQTSSLCEPLPQKHFSHLFSQYYIYLKWIYWKWRLCSRLMWLLKGINGAGLGIPCEKMSLQWPDKLSTWIVWVVLGEERGDPAGRGYEVWKASARI